MSLQVAVCVSAPLGLGSSSSWQLDWLKFCPKASTAPFVYHLYRIGVSLSVQITLTTRSKCKFNAQKLSLQMKIKIILDVHTYHGEYNCCFRNTEELWQKKQMCNDINHWKEDYIFEWRCNLEHLYIKEENKEQWRRTAVNMK